jgi:[amino group carrier protein]-lysine/ornithine hydrolase
MDKFAVQLLEKMVAIPSLSGEEAALANFLAAQMTQLGLRSHIDAAGNVVGDRGQPDENGRFTCEIVLLGHMDTVPGEIPVRVENGRLYGRGTVDAKGPLATFIMAAAQANLTPGTRLLVIGAVEEEAATSKGARHAAGQYQPDTCIIGEPSGWDSITLGYKGRLLLDCLWEQPMGHTAGPDMGVGETAVVFWNAIQQYTNAHNKDKRLFDQILPSIRHIQTGSDGLTNRADLKLGFRLPPDFDRNTFAAALTTLAGEARLHFYAYEPAYQSERTTPLVTAFNRALRQAQTRPRYKLKTGTSDMNVVGPIWQCPIVAYGPGDSSLDHTPYEHISLKEYAQTITILQTVLENLQGRRGKCVPRRPDSQKLF